MRSRMQKTNPHKQTDFLRDKYMTAAREVVDTVKDPTELHQKAVTTREAQVRDVQSREREFYSFANRGGKHEVWGVVNYIDEMNKVVRQPIANYIKVEYGDAVKHVVAEDMPRPLRLAKENVMKHNDDFNDGEMLEMNCCVVKEIVAAKYVEVEDTLSPLILAKDSVMLCSCDGDNTEKEDILAELTVQLRVFPPTSGLRGGRAEGRGEAHREGADGQEQLGVQGRLADVGCFGRCRGSASFDPRLPGVLDANQLS
jgi:hypothetical protein